MNHVRGFVKEILFALLIWFVITTTVGEAREVPTPSMEPTILVGDRIWTDKLFLRFSQIERGDIIVFNPPFPSDAPYIKRVIGLPGETISIHDGKVWVNGAPLTEPYLAEPPAYLYGPVTVPAGKYLVLGDNRNHSNDGHVWGLLDARQIKARAVFRYWPPNRFGSLP